MKNQDSGEYRPDHLFYLTPVGDRAASACFATRWPDGSGGERLGLTPAGEHAADCILNRSRASSVLHAIAGDLQ